jgi:hypothetical protein
MEVPPATHSSVDEFSAQQPIPEEEESRFTSDPAEKGKYLTDGTLTSQQGDCQQHQPAPAPTLVMEFAVHLVSEHLLELQALAALMDSLSLRSVLT